MPETRPRLLMIGLDAADPVLLEGWIADGTLVNLARLSRAGTWGRLSTAARWLTGSPWPTFYTGAPPSEHGIYHDFQWRHERMEFAAPAMDWLPVSPFWRSIEGDVTTVVHDVPMTPGTEAFRGVEVTGWGSHDKLVPPESYPAELLGEVRRRFGDSPIQPDAYGRASVASLRELHAELLDLTRRSAELAVWLLSNRPWDLGIVAFGALHRGGHRFWDRSSVDGPLAGELGPWFDGALRELYVAADRAVGTLAAAAPGAAFFVFSLHGMMVNTARVDLLDDMLARVLRGPGAEPPRRGLMRRAGEAIPLPLRRALTNAIPGPLKNRLMTRWTTGGIDWARTPAFTLRADLHGYVRINLEGREPRGAVSFGEADVLCERIREGLVSFRDATTGDPFIEDVYRAADVFPAGARSDRLPDLIVRWAETPGALHEAVESPRFGRVLRSTPGRIPNGRSGNHRPQGFLLACGHGIAAGAKMPADADILDLPPTGLRLLGASASAPFAGKPLIPLLSA